MRMFDDRFNRDEKQAFVRDINAGRLLHAYIVEGATGIGKRHFARYASAAILCHSADKPCGVCPSCKKISQGIHSDVTFITPEKSTFSVDTVRSIKKSLFYMANESDRKIYILANAEKMTTAAQNAMLKFFEEPPDAVVLFILVSSRDALLPTVVSRGNPITLYPASDQAIRSFLKAELASQDDAAIEKAVLSSGGLPGAALDYFDKQQTAVRNSISALCRAMLETGIFNFSLQINGGKPEREGLRQLLEQLLVALSDVMRMKRKIQRMSLLDPDDALEFSRMSTSGRLSAMSDAIMRAYQSIDMNTNISLTLAVLSDEIRRIKR